MKLNINDSVKVKLNDHGREILKQQHELLFKDIPRYRVFVPPREDEQGWSTWQMWDLMQSFGPHIRLGAEVPFETEIELVIEEIV